MKPLIWIESVIEQHAHSRIEFMVKAKTFFVHKAIAAPSIVEMDKQSQLKQRCADTRQ